MKLTPPPITKGGWSAQYDNPLCVVPGHTIKAKDRAFTPVAIVLKGHGASAKGKLEQRANATAVQALPQCLEALATAFEVLHSEGCSEFMLAPYRAALLSAGYTITE